MATYAQISDGTVTNVVVCDDTEHATECGWVCVDDLDPRPGIGWSYDGDTFTAAPMAATPAVPLTVHVDADALCDVMEQIETANTIPALRESVTLLAALIGGGA